MMKHYPGGGRRLSILLLCLALAHLFVASPVGARGAGPQPVNISVDVPNLNADEPQRAPNPADVADRVRLITDEVIAASYPELRQAEIRIKLFRSESDYFRASFSFRRFFFHRKMRYYVLANPQLIERQAPENGIRAIIAHELGHVLYFKRRNRIELLGLVRLLSPDFTIHFEKWADLQAISRGYSTGLKEYREWLYLHIPAKKIAEKKRNYYSPEEIDHLASVLQKHPEKLADWLKHVPKNPLNEIGNDEL
jgi:hypothetical protein